MVDRSSDVHDTRRAGASHLLRPPMTPDPGAPGLVSGPVSIFSPLISSGV